MAPIGSASGLCGAGFASVGEIDLAARNVGKGRDAVVTQRRVQHGAVLVIDHLLVERPPKPMAMAPSTWPRPCIGLISLPTSAVCALCKVIISPVTRCTATRTPCTLNP